MTPYEVATLKHVSFGRKVKLAHKNAQREYSIAIKDIDKTNKKIRWNCDRRVISMEVKICLRHSYPLGLLVTDFLQWGILLNRKSDNIKWSKLSYLAKVARKKGKIIPIDGRFGKYKVPSDIIFSTYNLTHILERGY